MKRVGIVYLITEKPEARGVLDAPTETRRKTYCEEKSLSMSEVYQARASGFSPVYRLVLPQDFEYRGETLCEYRGDRYEIIREYRDEKTGDSTELTIQRVRGNAAPPAEGTGEDPSTAPGGSAQDDTVGTTDGSAQDDTAAEQGEPAVTGGTTESGPATQQAEGGEP
jgi:hypothetical protein